MIAPPEDQWEYIGACVECGSSLYTKDGKLRSSQQTSLHHCCRIENRENKD